MISYEGIDEATLINGLYHGTGSLPLNTPAGLIERMSGGSRVTIEVVQADLADDGSELGGDRPGEIYTDYYRGRPLKVLLDTKAKTFNERGYDMDAGQGAAARVVDSLRKQAA